MLLTKLKIAVGVLLVLAVIGATTTLIACQSLVGRQPASPNPAPKNAPVENRANAKEQEKEQEKPHVDRSALRYGGKDFAYWRNVMRTELKPEDRLEAFRALQAFARKGYADETEAALLEAIREDVSSWATIIQRNPYERMGSGRGGDAPQAYHDPTVAWREQAERKVLIEAFGRVGPAAKEAVFALERIIRNREEQEDVQKLATEALKRIQPPDSEKPKPE